MRMESFWRWLGVALGKYWKIVLSVVVLITVVLGVRRPQHRVRHRSGQLPEPRLADRHRQRRLPGRLRWRDRDPAVHLDRRVRRRASSTRERTSPNSNGSPPNSKAVDGALCRRHAVDVAAVQRQPPDRRCREPTRCCSAAARDEAGAEARQADISIALARLGAIPDAEQVIGNPAYNELLIYDNTGFVVDDGVAVAPPTEELAIRASLAGHVPERRGRRRQRHRRRWRRARRERRPRRADRSHQAGRRRARRTRASTGST